MDSNNQEYIIFTPKYNKGFKRLCDVYRCFKPLPHNNITIQNYLCLLCDKHIIEYNTGKINIYRIEDKTLLVNIDITKWSTKLTDSFESTPNFDKYGRTSFLRDYGAIIHSSKFRRLAHKTQVYLNTQIDYPRTRLTHSIEVSQIGRQLARAVANKISSSSKKK